MDAEFSRRMQQVEALVHDLEEASDRRLRERAQELVRALLDLHKAGLARVLDVIGTSGGGGRIVDELAADDLVANVLLLHDLHPVPLDVRVQRAIERVQARAAKHGAEVALLDYSEGRVLIRTTVGAGCGSSAGSIRQMVEEALFAEAPDLMQVEFEAADPPPSVAFVSLQQLKNHRPPASHPPSEPALRQAQGERPVEAAPPR